MLRAISSRPAAASLREAEITPSVWMTEATIAGWAACSAIAWLSWHQRSAPS
jgi:hypothetical protein